ncbi:MMPL family transporter [Alicyclobacillus sp.]|uniref:MMPL family transporter n=1 Tax=Alicyclobacillus sp. TaxID=61169 RepID=UPI0025C0F29A|nr:MMPL family transporter [Alicyclobacillus sp.]MCL6516802.1 MMPL family transporter [Alicyclobacillus sp.]
MKVQEHSWWIRLGRWVTGRWGRWCTLAVWLVLISLLSMAAPQVNRVEVSNAEDLPLESASIQAQKQIDAAFPDEKGIPALLVWYRDSGLTAEDRVSIQAVARSLREHPVAHQQGVVPLDQMPEQALTHLASDDGTTLVLPVSFAPGTGTDGLQQGLKDIRNTVRTALGLDPFAGDLGAPGLHARITGPAGIATDAIALFQNADVTLLVATALLVLILLMVLYRSPVLALVPLVSVCVAYGGASPLLGWLASRGWITVDAQSVSIMTVLLFGAGTDYCLFLIARFRERLYQERDVRTALVQAMGGAAGAIAVSGLTVVVSLLALLAARFGSYHRFAVPFAIGVLMMALVALTFVPALLAILGRRAFYPFIPATAEMHGRFHRHRTDPAGRLSRWNGRVVTRRPWAVGLAGVVVLGALATAAFGIRPTYNLLASFPSDMPSREGYTLLAEHASPGALAPVQVLVEPASRGQAVADRIAELPFVASVAKPEWSDETDAALVTVTLRSDPYSAEAMANLPALKQAAAEAAPTIWVGGETARQYDSQQWTQRDTRWVVGLVICVIAILLLGYLRSVVATVYLLLTVLLSFAAALGAGWLVTRHILGQDAMQGAIPLYAFVFLVALGEDYNLFMMSRIWQEASAGVSLRDAIRRGVAATSGVISSAGLILAATFAVLAGLPIQVLVQFGVTAAIGVLMDTFIVRPFLVPAITSLLGRWAFWPRRMRKRADA